MHVTNDQFLDKFNNGWKKSKWLIYCVFLLFKSIISPCGHDNLKSFSCIFPKFVMYVTNDQFSDKFDNGWKKSKWLIYWDFLHFTSIMWRFWSDNIKSFTFILFKFVMHVTNKQFSDKFDNGCKITQNGRCDFLHFTSIIWPCGCNNSKFNNDGRLLSSVLLFYYLLMFFVLLLLNKTIYLSVCSLFVMWQMWPFDTIVVVELHIILNYRSL